MLTHYVYALVFGMSLYLKGASRNLMKNTWKHVLHYLLTVRLTVWLGVAVVMAGGALMANVYLLSSQEDEGRTASQHAAAQPLSRPAVWLYHKSVRGPGAVGGASDVSINILFCLCCRTAHSSM